MCSKLKIKVLEQRQLTWVCFLVLVVAQRCSVKKVFLEIKQNSQENTCVRVSFLIKLQAEVCELTPFFIEHLRWLLLLFLSLAF